MLALVGVNETLFIRSDIDFRKLRAVGVGWRFDNGISNWYRWCFVGYGALTIEMCNVGSIDYKLNYRDHNHFATALQPTSSLSHPSADSKYVPTKHIFKKWVKDVLRKLQTRYPNVLLCVFCPDPLNDPDVRRFYTDLMQSKCKSNLSGPTTEVKLKVRTYLQTRVSDYNQANHFLAEVVIRHTIFKQSMNFMVWLSM